MLNVWFTSDSHYGHRNIVKSLSSWSDKRGCRDFDSVEEMNDALVSGINAVVAPDDTLYHLGDWNFGGLKNQAEFRSRVVCENIHLICGNHDFNHRSIDPNTVAHGFSSVSDYKEIVIKGQEIVLSHYAFRVWNRQGKGSWHLYGHSHGQLPELKNKSMDIGVDTIPGWFDPQPWSFDEVKDWMSQHVIKCEDSHGRSDETSKPITRLD